MGEGAGGGQAQEEDPDWKKGESCQIVVQEEEGDLEVPEEIQQLEVLFLKNAKRIPLADQTEPRHRLEDEIATETQEEIPFPKEIVTPRDRTDRQDREVRVGDSEDDEADR